MSSSKKLLQAAAGSAGGAGLNIEDVFSTYLYEGNGSTQTITNGIDLSGEGGLVWIKERGLTRNHHLVDTERGIGDGIRALRTNLTSAEYYQSGYDAYEVTSANSNGFSVGLNLTNETNRSGSDYASWTFRKAPKFFDVVTWTGDGTGARTISHNLGSTPGSIIRKKTSGAERWYVWHRSVSNDLSLNETTAASYIAFNLTDPTSTEFTVSSSGNISGETHVAYLFAHNDGDGEFGPTGDQDIIKCGSYSGNSTVGHTIDLGFEAQWVLVRSTSNLRKWMLYDAMRGMPVDGNGAALYPNSTDDEEALTRIGASNVGFQLTSTDSMVNLSGETYIYIAIRRGPMAVPESATDVFDVNTYSNNGNSNIYNTGFNTDMNINKNATSSDGFYVIDRLRGAPFLLTNLTVAETGGTSTFWNTGNNLLDLESSWWSTTSGVVSWSWKRAPNFFDVVAYTGNGTAGRTVSHNLGVAPEMMWVKRRNTTGEWAVYHSGVDASAPQDYYTLLGATNAKAASTAIWNDTAPTADVFSLGTIGWVNASSDNYIAYLFASVDGVSKVFSVTKSSGSDASVNCGFSAGPRFVLLKRTDSTGDWYVWDSERGIVAGNDPYLLLNSTAAEVTSTDYIDPTSNGFTIVNGGLADGDYIGYAVA